MSTTALPPVDSSRPLSDSDGHQSPAAEGLPAYSGHPRVVPAGESPDVRLGLTMSLHSGPRQSPLSLRMRLHCLSLAARPGRDAPDWRPGL